jgi:hypothetical protein
MTIDRLHFVYNVEGTPKALLKDFMHRLRDPESYPCKLCDLTYGRFVKKPRWQFFIWSLPVKSVFYTRDRFVRKYPKLKNQRYPAVLAESGGRLHVFITRNELRTLNSLEQFETLLEERLRPRAAAARSKA